MPGECPKLTFYPAINRGRPPGRPETRGGIAFWWAAEGGGPYSKICEKDNPYTGNPLHFSDLFCIIDGWNKRTRRWA